MTAAAGTSQGGPRRSRARLVLAVVFAILALIAWLQVLRVPLGLSAEPPVLTVLQAVIGTAAMAAAWGSWAGSRWAPVSAAVCGLVTAGMLVALAPMLDLEPEAGPGLWAGAAAVLLFGLSAGSYLRRAGLTPES